MKEYAKQSNKQESTNSDLEDQAAIYLEEMNISGDTMVQMNHHLDDMPKDKIGAYYLNDLMAGFVQEQLNIAFVSQHRELFVSFARFAHNYGKGSYGTSYEEMFSEWLEKRNK